MNKKKFNKDLPKVIDKQPTKTIVNINKPIFKK